MNSYEPQEQIGRRKQSTFCKSEQVEVVLGLLASSFRRVPVASGWLKPRDVHFRILSPHTRSQKGTLNDSSVALELLDASETEGRRERRRGTPTF